jgi:hypothetical protein
MKIAMKQKIYILGLVTTILVFTGALFKMNHFPAAGILLTLGIFMLILLFLPLALRNHYRTKGDSKNLILYIVTWLTCFVVFAAMLFKILHWPGAGYLLFVALPFPFVVFLPVFLYITSKNKNFSIYNTVYMLFLLTLISAFSALLALDVSKERMVDSLGIVRNYTAAKVTLDINPSGSDKPQINRKIDVVLGDINEYRELMLKQIGCTLNQWEDEPEIITVSGLSQIGKSKQLSGEESSAKHEIETGLSELISLLEVTSGCNELSKAAPDIFGLHKLSDNHYVWTDEMESSSSKPWSLIYIEGLETNLKMINTLLIATDK